MNNLVPGIAKMIEQQKKTKQHYLCYQGFGGRIYPQPIYPWEKGETGNGKPTGLLDGVDALTDQDYRQECNHPGRVSKELPYWDFFGISDKNKNQHGYQGKGSQYSKSNGEPLSRWSFQPDGL